MIRIDRRIIMTVLALSVCGSAAAQETPSCDSAVYRPLDFWVGTWDVRLEGSNTVIGTNTIEKTLNGCAILEHWTDARGSRGKSLFYYHDADKVWKQVWVTDAGRVKEKRMLPESSSTVVIFQGEVRRDDGTRVLDRTTLSNLGDGRVRQRIVQSADGGATWDSGFNAVYTRKPTEGKLGRATSSAAFASPVHPVALGDRRDPRAGPCRIPPRTRHPDRVDAPGLSPL